MNRIEEIKSRYTTTDPVKLNHFMGDVRNNSTGDWVAEFKQEVDAEKFINVHDDVQYLLAKLEQAEKALDVARVHISGEAEKFSEREKTPVLFRINEALAAIRS